MVSICTIVFSGREGDEDDAAMKVICEKSKKKKLKPALIP